MKDVIIAVLAVSCILALIAIWIQHKLLKSYIKLFDCFEAEPCAFRHSFDGYGWLYMDNGSGSSWKEVNKPDKEFLYALK